MAVQRPRHDSAAEARPAKAAPHPGRGPDEDEQVKGLKGPDQGTNNHPSPTATPSEDDSTDPSQSPELDENHPPLPNEAPPTTQITEDDGWAPLWDEANQTFYFHNRFTGVTQWENPRVPDAGPTSGEPALQSHGGVASSPSERLHGGYDPSIHGSYDPTASYALEAARQEEEKAAIAAGVLRGTGAAEGADYTATGAFNRFTGKWQAAHLNPENHNDENKSRRQMNAYFDVDAAANRHHGRSLKAERSAKKLSRQELKAFKEKRKEKKEEKRRAWLKD